MNFFMCLLFIINALVLFFLIVLIILFCSELKHINKTKSDVEYMYQHIAEEVTRLDELHKCMVSVNKDIAQVNVNFNDIKNGIKDLKEFNELFKDVYSYNKLVDKNWADTINEKLDKLNTNNINNSEKTSIINQLDSLKSQTFEQLQEYNKSVCELITNNHNNIKNFINELVKDSILYHNTHYNDLNNTISIENNRIYDKLNNTNNKIKAIFSLGSDFDADKARLSQQKRNRGKKPKSATTFDNGDNA